MVPFVFIVVALILSSICSRYCLSIPWTNNHKHRIFSKAISTRSFAPELWKQIPRHNPSESFRGVLELYKKQLDQLGFSFVGRQVLVINDQNTPLYLLLYASQHPKGKEFWDKAMRGVLPTEFDFGN